MASAKLDRLPLETLQRIASYLHHTYRPSLYALSLANRACHRATLRYVFRDIHLAVGDAEALRRDVGTLVKVLSGAESAHHVRLFGIKGCLFLNIGEPSEPGMEARTSNRDENDDDDEDDEGFDYYGVERDSVHEILGDQEPFLPGAFFDDEPIEVSPEEDMAWAPVVNLVKTLPRLTELVYDCRNQFPPSLLDALHKHHPQCKLYHLTFRLRSLRCGAPDPHEMAIATSPCLHSIKVRYTWRDSDGQDDYNEEAVRELVAGLAPNLKEVRMVHLVASRTSRSIRRLTLPRAPWPGFPGFGPGHRMGSLTSLSLVGAIGAGPSFLQDWSNYTDFSCLHRLALGGGVGNYYVYINDETMRWMAENCSFPRLKALYVCLGRNDDHVEKPDYALDAIAFFKAFEPLDELSVSGPLEPEIVDAILVRHGPTLTKLSLRPSESESSFCDGRPHIPLTFNKGHILQIRAQCPALQDLALSVKRTKSDAREVDIYRAFGKMERLQFLFLTLDCSNWAVNRGSDSVDDLSFDEDDRRLYTKEHPRFRRGHLRETFMNCAVDETLARSIWETICRAKEGKPLESLKLYTAGGGKFGMNVSYNDTYEVVANLSRSWLIERGVRDDKDTINVRELGRRSREARDKHLTRLYDEVYQGGSALPHHSTVHILRRIWPAKEGSKDWREDWASLPLQG
ncbi:Kinase subdomain-containing protein [Madurella fahalii]|uniref:Kinase subdomain-containing protein n=1 Tax=Madurella fahalii TaxID=1157608 RepID=A0ABQ0GPP6_9PEZI